MSRWRRAWPTWPSASVFGWGLALISGSAGASDGAFPATALVSCGPYAAPRFEITLATRVRGRTLRLIADSTLDARAVKSWNVDGRGLERNARASLCFDGGIPADVLALDPPIASIAPISQASSASSAMSPPGATPDPRRCIGPRSGGFVIVDVTPERVTGFFTLKFSGVGFIQGSFEAVVSTPTAVCPVPP